MKISFNRGKKEDPKENQTTGNSNFDPTPFNKEKGGVETPNYGEKQDNKNNYEGFQRSDSQTIDIEKIKRELMESIKNEEKAEKRRREEEIKRREEELKKVEEELKEEKENISNNNKFKRKSKMLLKNNPNGNEDYYNNYKIRVRNQRIKSLIFTSILILTAIGLAVCNVYYIFFKKETPVSEIESQIVSDRDIYMFPTFGVTEYLEKNLVSIIGDNVSVTGGTGAKDWTIQNIRIRKFNLYSDTYANVFFSADMVTSIGTQEHNYILALRYDYKTKSYLPASPLISRTIKFNDTTEFNPDYDVLWGFGDHEPKDEDKIEDLKVFLEQYFIMLYTNKSYPAASLKLENGDTDFLYNEYSFNFIDKIEYYDVVNNMGANCKVIYNVQSSEGLTHTITTYLKVEPSNEGSYKITTVF